MDRAVLSPALLWSMTRETVTSWLADFAPSMGAGIAYYTTFSIGPLLIIVITIAGLFFGKDAASGYVYAQLSDLLGPAGAQTIRGMVDSAGTTNQGIVAPITSNTKPIIGATTVFNELQSDLDRIWKAPAAKTIGLWGMLRSRILSLGLVVSIGFLMLVSLVVSAALAAFGKWWGGLLADLQWVVRALDFAVSLGVISVMFALMYKILPRVKIGWRDVWVGSVATALLFTIGKILVGLYIGQSRVGSGFGAAGSLVIVLVWVYYSAQIFLLGAEFTWVYAHRLGSRREEKKPATAKQSLDAAPVAAAPADAAPADDAAPVPGRVSPTAAGSRIR
jgi:membrane protein